LNYYQPIVVASCYLQISDFHPVFSDSNSHFIWPCASHHKPFLVLCGQLELGKSNPRDSQTGLSGLAIPGFPLHSTDSLDRSGLF
jgi:hypothetical protein